MKQTVTLDEKDIQDAVAAWLQGKGYKPISTQLRITPPYNSQDPRERSTSGSVRYECEVEPNHD